MSNLRSDRSPLAFLIGFLVGATAGTATALLLAPMSGKETRSMLEDKAVSAKDALEKQMDDVRARTTAQVQHAKTVGTDLINQASETLSDYIPKVGERVSSTLKQALSNDKPKD